MTHYYEHWVSGPEWTLPATDTIICHLGTRTEWRTTSGVPYVGEAEQVTLTGYLVRRAEPAPEEPIPEEPALILDTGTEVHLPPLNPLARKRRMGRRTRAPQVAE